MSLSPTALRVIIAVAGLVLVVAKQLLAGNFDVPAIIAAVDLGDLLVALGLMTAGSQIAKRAGDSSPKQVEAKVEQKVAAKVASLPPPSVINVTMPTVQSPTAGDGELIRAAIANAEAKYGKDSE